MIYVPEEYNDKLLECGLSILTQFLERQNILWDQSYKLNISFQFSYTIYKALGNDIFNCYNNSR